MSEIDDEDLQNGDDETTRRDKAREPQVPHDADREKSRADDEKRDRIGPQLALARRLPERDRGPWKTRRMASIA